MGRRAKEPRPTVGFGTRVRLIGPWHGLEAVVIAHGGFTGVHEREYVRIRALHEDSYFEDTDWPLEELEIVPPPHMAYRRRFNVGERVLAHFPYGCVEARVTEDRGWILQGDSQVVRVRAVEETYYVNEFDIPTDFLEVLPPEPRSVRKKRKRPFPM